MSKYKFAGERYKKYYKLSVKICAISLIAFIILNAISTGSNQVLNIVVAVFFYLFIATGLESIILFVLSKIFNR